jgi:hypothetical protein
LIGVIILKKTAIKRNMQLTQGRNAKLDKVRAGNPAASLMSVKAAKLFYFKAVDALK